MRQGKLFVAIAILFGCAAGAYATNFAVLLRGQDGRDTKVDGCQSVEIDDITWDYKEVKTNEFPVEVADDLTLAKKLKYKTYQPGQPHYGNAKFTSACTLGGSKELQAWFQEAARGGQGSIRDVSCLLYFEDGKPNRTFTLKDCFPVSFTACTPQADGTESVTLEVSIGGVQMDDLSNGRMRKRPEILYQAWDDAIQDYVSEAWDVWGGGDEWSISTFVGTNRFRTNSPGHKSVGEITLRGKMTDGRKNLCTWINETVNGKPWKRALTITELLSVDGGVRDRKYNYHDCFPIRYVFPQMSVANTTGNTMEEVTVKPIRVELK